VLEPISPPPTMMTSYRSTGADATLAAEAGQSAATMQIGRYDARAVRTASFRLDGGAMFGIVPRPVWEKELAPDADNRIGLALRCLLLRGEGRTIVVDTGIGEKGGTRFDERFAVAPPPPPGSTRLAGALAELDVRPEDVTDCVLTHLHWDHAGGAVAAGPGGALAPQFPRATYWLQRAHWEHAQAPTERDAGSFRRDDWAALDGQLRLVDGAVELLPGVRARLSGGHTPGLQLVHVDDGAGGGLVYCADLLPTAHHLRPSWTMGYDLFPAACAAEKRALLEEAAARGWLLFFEHDPATDAATVRFEGDRPLVDRTVAL